MSQETGYTPFDFESLELYKKSLYYIDFFYDIKN